MSIGYVNSQESLFFCPITWSTEVSSVWCRIQTTTQMPAKCHSTLWFLTWMLPSGYTSFLKLSTLLVVLMLFGFCVCVCVWFIHWTEKSIIYMFLIRGRKVPTPNILNKVCGDKLLNPKPWAWLRSLILSTSFWQVYLKTFLQMVRTWIKPNLLLWWLCCSY